jgi:hypothetical protein
VNTPFHSPAARSAAAVAAALAVVLSSGATLTASAVDQPTGSGAWSVTDPSGRHGKFVDKHGRVLESPQLYLIYWGGAWQAAPTPTADEVTDAVRTLMASSYLMGLTQYRGSGQGALRGSALVASSDPPDGFTDDQVAHFVDDQIALGTVPGPDPDNQTVYGVVMPTGITPEVARRAEHYYYKRSGQRIPYAWFTNVGDLDSITALVSHELVEVATDPDGSGFLGVKGTCDESGWCEIADVCESTWSTVDGVMVQGYWSNQHNDCIPPNNVAPEPVAPEPVAPTRPGNVTIRPTTGHAQGEAP